MKKYTTFIIVAVIGFVFWNIILPGPRYANDFPFAFNEIVREGFSLPSSWLRTASNFGNYSVNTLWSWPVDFIYGIGGQLGFDFSVLQRLLGIVSILILSCWSINKLLKYYKIGDVGRISGILFFVLNTYLILLIDGGQFAIALSYALIPYLFLLITSGILGTTRQKIIAALFVSILGFLDIRFVYGLGLLVGFWVLYQAFIVRTKLSVLIKGIFISSAIISLIFVGLNFYWILPSIASRSPELPAGYDRISQTSFLSFANISNGLLMLQPHWYKNIFGQIAHINPIFFGIPLIAFIAPIVNRKNKTVLFWLIICLSSIFLVKGSQEPFPSIYSWLFTNIPGFSLFRDPTKFFFLIAISYAVLISMTFEWLYKKITRSYFAIMVFIVYLLILTFPVYSLGLTGILSPAKNVQNYFELNEIISRDKERFERVLWVPRHVGLGYFSPTKPLVDSINLLSKRPFALGVFGTYELNNYLREFPRLNDFFDISGIKYIVYPYPDPRRTTLKPEDQEYFYKFFDQIAQKDWAKEIYKIGSGEEFIGMIETTATPEQIFPAKDSFAVVGSDRIYWDINHETSIKDLSLIFVEEKPGSILRALEHNAVRVLLYEKDIVDLQASFINESNYIVPSRLLDFDPDDTGWWKREALDFISWKNFLQEKYNLYNIDFDYGMGWAISEGSNKLNINSDNFEEDKVLLARVMNSSRGGNVNFYQDGNSIGQISTLINQPEKIDIPFQEEDGTTIYSYDKANFGWYEVGILNSSSDIEILTQGEINVINALAVVNIEEWQEIQRQASLLRVESLNQLSYSTETPAEISYKKNSPTSYTVNVRNINRPFTLAFSESYDPLWTLKKENNVVSSSLPIYTFINGFEITENGDYEIYFSPQEYVDKGLVVSLSTLIIISSYFLYTFYNDKKVK